MNFVICKSAENYVRPDEAEKVKSTIRERGSLKVIDKVTVTLNEKRDVYEALLGNLGVKGVEVPKHHRQEVREAAGRRHLVHRHAGVLLRGGPEGVAVRAAGLEADPDAEHGPGGAVPGTAGVHRGAVDRRPAALDRHGADELHGAGEVAPAGPHDPAGREQLQPLRTRAAGHGQEPHLQGDQPEQHPGLRWADHGREPVLQHGPASGRAGRPVGRGGLRRSGGHLVQGQGWRPDHEGLHGFGFVRPWPGCRSTPTPRWCSSATSTSRSIRWSRRATCSPRSRRR